MNMQDKIAAFLPSFQDGFILPEDVAQAIIDALPDMVPDLVWGTTSYGNPECYIANGVYRINNATNGGYSVVFKRGVIRKDDGTSNWVFMEDAKAAANTHNRAQIMAAFGVTL